jgi:phosphodiesterase/alkaline phosphatase D-like protein
MATTITAFTDVKGNKTFPVRGTVGTAEALVFNNLEGFARVRVLNNDQTAVNSVAIGFASGTTVGSGYLVYGGTTLNNGVDFYLAPGEKLYAIAAADRDVTFICWPNCNQG